MVLVAFLRMVYRMVLWVVVSLGHEGREYEKGTV